MVDKERNFMRNGDAAMSERGTKLSLDVIKSAWNKKLQEGFTKYDPADSSLKVVDPYTVRYVPGRLKYLKDTAPIPFETIDMPHDLQDVFCAARDQVIADQKIAEVSLRNFTWDVLVNNNPIEIFHSMLIPQREASNQILRSNHLADLLQFVEANSGTTIAFNSFGAGASQNHFHVHLFLTDWSVEKIKEVPIDKSVFSLDDAENINGYIESLVRDNIAHNIVITKDGLVVTPRKNEHINGIRYGVDAVSGRFLTTSLTQFETISRERADNIMDIIAFKMQD